MTARIPNHVRREVYRRDGWRCALCDCSQTLQVHHVIPRGKGGSNAPQNLITLCSRCHAAAHGHDLDDTGITAEDMEQLCLEYIQDYYIDGWYPWAWRSPYIP